MIIGPPKRPARFRPVALVAPGYRSLSITTGSGTVFHRGPTRCGDALAALDGWAVYVNGSLTALRHTTGARCWTASTWRGRATSMTLDGTKVTAQSLRGALEGAGGPNESYNELTRALDYFAAYGVAPAGLSAMGWKLFTTTLAADVAIAARPQLGRSALFGGRQEVRNHLDADGRPRELSNMVAVDLSGAYPHAMGSAPYALGLRRVSPDTTRDPAVPGLVEATVGVDADLPYKPLPWRIAQDMIMSPYGYVQGIWTWGELAAAADLGCSVRVARCWAPTNVSTLFNLRWTDAVATGRALGGPAGRITKAAANSVWGMFGMRGDQRGTVRWTDDAGLQPLAVPLRDVPLPHAATCHVAAETAARVRVRMLREGLYGGGSAPIHVDTDGYIVRKSSCKGLSTTAVPGAWRVKQSMHRVDVRAPQVYRYTCGTGCGIDHPRWHYVTAGTPPGLSEQLFNRLGQHGAWVSNNGLDIVLPSWSANDRPGVRRTAREARAQLGA